MRLNNVDVSRQATLRNSQLLDIRLKCIHAPYFVCSPMLPITSTS